MKQNGGIVVVGGLNLDIQGRSAGPFRPGDSNPGSSSRSPGGVGRNIAENLARLGMKVELVTALGTDALSEELAASCDRCGIGLSGAVRLAGASSSQYISLFDRDGTLIGAVAAMDGIQAVTPEALAERSSLLDAAAAIVVDANLPAESIGWLANRYGAKNQVEGRAAVGPLLVLDPVSVAKAGRAAPWVGSFSMAKPNLAEAAVLAGAPLAAHAAYPTTGLKLARSRELALFLRSRGLREIFISLGRDGLYAEGPGPADGETERIHARPDPGRPAAEAGGIVSGGGDAACAALVWGAVSGLPLRDRAALAVAAALLAATSELTVNPALGPESLRETAKGVLCEKLS